MKRLIRQRKFRAISLIGLACGLLGLFLVWWWQGLPPPWHLDPRLASVGFATGFLVPIGLSIFNVFWKETLFQNLPMLMALGFGLLFDLVFLLTLGLASAWTLGLVDDNSQLWHWFGQVPVVIGLTGLVTLLILNHLIQMIRLIVGQGQLAILLLGRRKYPQVLERFVLAIELKNPPASTLDRHSARYLSFLNDFFQDLEAIAGKHRADILEFTHQGAVLAWPELPGGSNSQSIQLVYDLRTLLKQHETWFLEVYQTSPRFRAALHFGRVNSAEMGWTRRTIMTQGAVLDTVKRLMLVGIKVNEDFLVTDSAMERLVLPTGSRIHRGLNVQTGKNREECGLYALEQLEK